MISSDLIQLLLYNGFVLFASYPLGLYMAQVYEGRQNFFTRLLAPVERLIYKVCGVNPSDEMDWKHYAKTFLLFNMIGVFFVYFLQRAQSFLPLNPETLPAVSADSALNTAVSFASNTNWQGYSGELTLSYLSQMLGLGVQNFVSAASGMAVAVALIRAFARAESDKIGNFWIDLVRSTLHVLMPLSFVLSIVLVSQGTVQTLSPYVSYIPVDSAVEIKAGDPARKIALGPAASQIAIKQLGTNGGGFFNVNSSHPLENPTPLSNFAEMISLLLIAAALCWTFGEMVKNKKQGLTLFLAMSAIYLAGLATCYYFESVGNVEIAKNVGINTFNMEGKELRFGAVNSVIWAVATTAVSNGSVNSMHDSLTPMAGLVPMLLMQLGEVIFGGVGSGLYGMIVFAIITVFISGLMVGRTPEYLGKKIEAFEMKMSSLVILIPPILVLGGTAIAVSLDVGRSSVLNPGAHGFSEILYAFSSAGNNNGSAFAGLNANTVFYNISLAVAMFFARYWLAIPVLAMAGALAKKKLTPPGVGTMPTDNYLFVTLLVGVVLIFGALTFVPALALGPVVEHLQMVNKP